MKMFSFLDVLFILAGGVIGICCFVSDKRKREHEAGGEDRGHRSGV